MTGNFNIVNVSMVVVGAILIYCGVKNITPKQAMQQVIAGAKSGAPIGTTPAPAPVPFTPINAGPAGGNIRPAAM